MDCRRHATGPPGGLTLRRILNIVVILTILEATHQYSRVREGQGCSTQFGAESNWPELPWTLKMLLPLPPQPARADLEYAEPRLRSLQWLQWLQSPLDGLAGANAAMANQMK